MRTVETLETRVAEPTLTRYDAPTRPRAMAMFLHGGKDRSQAAVTGRSASWRRALSLAMALRTPLHAQAVGLWVLRYRQVGWNGDGAGPIEDARWALDELRQTLGEVPVVLVGHSMGGRTACRVADHELVRGVVALAPWLPTGEPIEALSGRELHAAHGTRDHITRPRETRAYVERARSVATEASFTDMPGVGHYLLRGVPAWNAFTLAKVRAVLAG